MVEQLKPLETVDLNIVPPVAYVTLNRPDVRNAMNGQMVTELQTVFYALRENRDIRAIVLSGAGGAFCAGGDINELRDAMQNPAGSMNTDHNFERLIQAVNQAPQVVIARVEGAALGGGLGLVCVSDIAIASTDARFGMPEVRLGVVPSFISPYVIQRLGLTRARELILTGRQFDGTQAKEYGLVHEVCSPEKLDDCVDAVVDDIRQCGPYGLAAAKALIFEVLEKSPDQTLEYRAQLLDTIRRSPEAQEGMLAFMQKRPPTWAVERDDDP